MASAVVSVAGGDTLLVHVGGSGAEAAGVLRGAGAPRTYVAPSAGVVSVSVGAVRSPGAVG
jgi:hypothetical protein